MGISGSDLAPTQARFGVMRFGAFRFGYYRPNVVIKIGGVQTNKVIEDSLDIYDRLNGRRNEAIFTVRAGVTVTEGMTVTIALGADSIWGTRLFAGTIVRVRTVQPHLHQDARYQVSALDFSWLLDRRPISAEYRSESATAIARDLVTTYVWSGFTANHVEPDLPSVDHFPVTNVRPSEALNRLAKRVGASWYIDDTRDLHFFTDESVRYPNPPSLTSSNHDYWDFRVEKDLSQVRTRIIVEYKSTRVLGTGVPAGATSVPILDWTGFSGITTARIGPQLITYAGLNTLFESAGENPLGGTVDADAAVGATTLDVNIGYTGGTPFLIVISWVKVGDQVISFTGVDFPGGSADPVRLTGIPASGYGSIRAAVAAGTAFHGVSSLEGVTDLNIAVPADTIVVPRLTVDDAGAQAALAALDGTDGIRVLFLQDGRLTQDGAQERAEAELAAHSTAIITVQYKTRDVRTRSGRTVSVNVAGITDDFLIQEVRLTGFDQLAPITSRSPMAFPVKDVSALPLRLTGLIDLLSREEDTL